MRIAFRTLTQRIEIGATKSDFVNNVRWVAVQPGLGNGEQPMTFEFTAWTEADLLATGIGNGRSLGKDDVITVPGSTTLTFSGNDADGFLSGDNVTNEAADDSDQTATALDSAGADVNAGRVIFAENARLATDANGNEYLLIQIEQNSTSGRTEFFSFYEGTFNGVTYSLPPAGAELTLGRSWNVTDAANRSISYDGLGGAASPALDNIVDIATGSDDFNILVQALSTAGLVDTVQNATDITVFAPTDAAFVLLAGQLGYTGDTSDEGAVFGFISDTLASLDPNGDPIPLLTDILVYHVAAGDQTGATGEVTTLLGTTFEVNGTELIDNDPEADNPNVLATVAAENGQIQVIDNVLLPIDTPIGQVLTTMIHVCENDGDLSIDFGTHECIYTEDVFFAKATPKEVFKAGDAVNVQLQYLEIAEGSVVSPELIAVGAQDDVIGIDIRIANSDFNNLDVKKILTFDTSVLENFLLSNGGDSVVISQFDNVRVYDPATGNYSLEVAEARVYVDGFGPATRDTPGLVAELEALIAQEQAVTITYLDSNHVEQTAEICIDFSHEPELFTPIALDLNGDGKIGVTGVSTVQGHEFDQNAATVEFDLDADGTIETIEWFNGDGDGILVNTDLIGPNNEIDGAALYGDQGGLFANGYEKLSQLEDDNGDGVINGAELDNVALWVDDGDAVLEDGELRTLESEGIKAISTEVTVEADGRMTSEAGVDLEATGEVSYSLEGPDAAFFQIDSGNGRADLRGWLCAGLREPAGCWRRQHL